VLPVAALLLQNKQKLVNKAYDHMITARTKVGC
jgi:hypothetical protein